MTYMQNPPPSGRIGRSTPARFAGRGGAARASQLTARVDRKIPLFAQFPPASLFKAIHRAVSRRAMMRQLPGGTAIANSRLWRAAGEP